MDRHDEGILYSAPLSLGNKTECQCQLKILKVGKA
jgi:hypothetical protein